MQEKYKDGELLFKERKYAEALDCLLSIEKKDVRLYTMIAYCYYAQNKHEEAHQYFKKAAALDSSKDGRNFHILDILKSWTRFKQLQKTTGYEKKTLMESLKELERNGKVVFGVRDSIIKTEYILDWDANAKRAYDILGIDGLRFYVRIDGYTPLKEIQKKIPNASDLLRRMVKEKIIIADLLNGLETPFIIGDMRSVYMLIINIRRPENPYTTIRNVSAKLKFHKVASLYVKRAQYYLAFGWFIKSVEDFKEAMKLDKKAVPPREYGVALYKMRKYDKAISMFTKAIKSDSEDYTAYYNRGYCYYSINRWAKALNDCKTALKLNPELNQAQRLRNYCLDKMGERNKVFVTQPQKLARVKSTSVRINLSDVGGMKQLREGKIKEILYLLKNPEKAKKYGINFGGGMLFYGPPGCGKSFVTEAIAGEAEVNFIKASIADTLNMYVGNSEKNIKEIFDAARRSQPAIIFFDEMEALGGNREGMHEHWQRQLVNQFLLDMDKIEKNNERILVIGATNAPWHIDHALKRSGRFSSSVFIGPPDVNERAEIFKIHCKKIELLDKIDYEKLAQITDAFSCADIATVCKETAKKVWISSFEMKKERKVTTKDFVETVSKMKPVSVKEWIELAKTKGMSLPDAKNKTSHSNMFG